MREIKFRGKAKETGKWVYGDLIHDAFVCSSLSAEVGIAKRGCYADEVDPETVAQYTGIKDKNGVEVFKGDIMKNKRDVFEVIWSEKESGWRPSRNRSIFQDSRIIKYSEVIGNIHDNPDLLERAE